MPFCPECKVELARDAEFCPLCASTVTETITESEIPKVTWAREIRDADEKEKLSPKEKRMMVFELLCVSFAIVLAVTVGVDILLFPGVTFCQYTSLVLVVVWLFAAMPLVLWGHPWLVYAVLGPVFLLAVFLWAVFSGGLLWYVLLGLPLSLLLEGVVVASSVLISIQKRKGLNAVGVILGAIVVLSTAVDFAVSLFLGHRPLLSWSVIVIFSLIPVSAFFFFLHYRVMNRASLRKVFRL